MKKLAPLIALFIALPAIPASFAAEPPAKAVPAAVNVTGVWSLDLQFSGGSGNPTFTLKQEGEKIVGRYSGGLGEADVTGTIKGNEVTFGFSIEGERLTYTGTISGDEMKGKAKLGQLGEGTFTGKRKLAK